MASFPSPKVHRASRRKLGRNQFPSGQVATVAVTSSGTTNVTMTFSKPVVVTGTIPITVGSTTLVSQTVVSPTVVTQVRSANVTGLAYSITNLVGIAGTYTGGSVAGTTGTFP